MSQLIRITRTSTVTYDPNKQDKDYYRDQEAWNAHQMATLDMEALEGNELDIDDIDAGDVEHTYTAVLVKDLENGLEELTPIDENDTTRDMELFPKDEEDEEDEEPRRLPEATFDGLRTLQ